MDDLSVALNNSGIGGYLGDAFLNHLCYADDICLISLSSDNVVRKKDNQKKTVKSRKRDKSRKKRGDGVGSLSADSLSSLGNGSLSRLQFQQSVAVLSGNPPCVELNGNPSWFVVYAYVRQAVLEQQVKQAAFIYEQSNSLAIRDANGSDSEPDGDDRHKEMVKIPQIVGLGLRGVFELIRETSLSYPALCARALQSLLDMLQGQQPEALSNEPAEIIDSLYTILLQLATSQQSVSSGACITGVACACLLSLVISCTDTGKLLSAAAALLMSSDAIALQHIQVPSIMIALQRSVHSVLLGKVHQPDWLCRGIRQNAHTDDINISKLSEGNCGPNSAIACDGAHLYIHNSVGLHKIGTGFGGTIKGHVYMTRADFHTSEPGWLAYASGRLFYKPMLDKYAELTVVNVDSLIEEDTYIFDGDNYGSNVIFSDGQHIGHVAAAKDDAFVVRTFNSASSPMTLIREVPLKLARKCVDVFGSAAFDTENDIHTLSTGCDEDVASIKAGKEFALLRTISGKMMYTGKSQCLGIKQPSSSNNQQSSTEPGQFHELTIPKSVKISDFSVGHDGQHALLLAEDGSVYFVGTAKKGEDGDISSKGRRPHKAVKPRKVQRLVSRQVSQVSCNSGTSAAVTKDGELYMFGKDTRFCDTNTGLVTDLKDIHISQVSLGKAHTVVLTTKGKVFTFGINNRGQCGQENDNSRNRDANTTITMGEDEDTEEDVMCLPGKHRFRFEHCMVCPLCRSCTGYGDKCVNVGKVGREPGSACGCGVGESGCVTCGVCRMCAGEDMDDDGNDPQGALQQALPHLLPNGAHAGLDQPDLRPVLEEIAQYGDQDDRLQFKEILLQQVGQSMKNAGGKQGQISISGKGRHAEFSKYMRKMKSKAKAQNKDHMLLAAAGCAANADVSCGSDYEGGDHSRLVGVAPSQVYISHNAVAVQVSAGLQFTVVLLDNGEVYSFGSNQYGQLGVGDTNARTTPARVIVNTHITQIATGSNHTVLLSSTGQVYACGNYLKGQLGHIDEVSDKKNLWHCTPSLVPGIGAKHGRRATWIGASGEQTFVRIDESLINAHTLAKSHIFANRNCIGLIPISEDSLPTINCLMINTKDGCCKSFYDSQQAYLCNTSVCLDPVYDYFWSYSSATQLISSYCVLYSDISHLTDVNSNLLAILKPQLMIPVTNGAKATAAQCALHILGCLDTLTMGQQQHLCIIEEEKEHQSQTKIYSKDDYSLVNRFESHGGGWGYSVHSVEAVRFMSDADVLLGGFGLFGGRGEYFGKIKLYELGIYGGDNETDGDLLAETDEVPYECGVREKFILLFDEPVSIQAGHWYVAMTRISGPSSDCGSGGQLSVTTDDQVVFKFKNSKKSNNGTDVNAGQIPQLLYRLPAHDTGTKNRKQDLKEPAHVLSREFSRSVSSECFDALLKLLVWSWNTFCSAVDEVYQLQGLSHDKALLDLQRLVFISTSSLRLLKIHICEVYPTQVSLRKSMAPESLQLADCVGDARSLLWKILAQSQRHFKLCVGQVGTPEEKDARHLPTVFSSLANQILNECYDTFVSCFHAFYPTPALKWNCLCDLLSHIQPHSAISDIESYSWLLAAVMQALCHPSIKLSTILPTNIPIDPLDTTLSGIYPSSRRLSVVSSKSAQDDNTGSVAQRRDSGQFPLLISYMCQRSDTKRGDSQAGQDISQWTFRDVLERLITITVTPARQKLNQERVTHSPLLVSKTCALLSAVISELAASATGFQLDVNSTSRPMLMTPCRFSSTSSNAYWNTGNGSPDAVCFTVDKPGITIAGVTLYGGAAQYNCEVEILDDTENSTDPSHTVRWNSLELVKITFGPDDCTKDITQVKFDRHIPARPGVKYAIRLRNRGPRTLNGDGGMLRVKGSDGTTFTFSACSLSSNGTNHIRGQIPNILYYSTPQEGESSSQNNKTVAEYQSRKTTIGVASSIIKAAAKLLTDMQSLPAEQITEAISSCHIFTTLLPLVMAYISPVAAIDPRGAVQVLGLVQEILPSVSELNSRLSVVESTMQTSGLQASSLQVSSLQASSLQSSSMHASAMQNSDTYTHSEATNTTSQHYAVVESDHPYKPATVANYKVTFPSCVRWMAIEFDQRCGTAQDEDCLQLFIPPLDSNRLTEQGSDSNKRHCQLDQVKVDADIKEPVSSWVPIMKKFHGTSNWPSMTVILPGNVMCFSLETASSYVKDEKATFFGFKCTVIGYQWSVSANESLAQLEREIACLGGMCAASLMKRDLALPHGSDDDDTEDDVDLLDEEAQQTYLSHKSLLAKGFALTQPPTIHQALDDTLPYCWQSNEKGFLKDFVSCAPGTSGSRLAAWLQPEPHLDPKRCEVVYNADDMKCSWPSVITVLTRDQYGHLVVVVDLLVGMRAVPIAKDSSSILSEDTNSTCSRRRSHASGDGLVFGGHPPPNLDVKYEITSRDKKDSYHAICMMKAYESYSFEELRYACPNIHHPTENMMVRCNNDGSYSASWTPSSVGWYNMQLTIDGNDTGESYKVEVKEPPQGVMPPTQNITKKIAPPNKMRKFVLQCSSGLRIRCHPTLQSEQLGVIAPEGIITFIDEIHNDDGVWLRLNAESASNWCPHATLSSGGGVVIEAWALQYHKQLGKCFLVPVDEPKSILDEIIKVTINRRNRPELGIYRERKRKGGTGIYQLIKCGASGHNVRSKPNMRATPIGMLVLYNQIDVTEELQNDQGVWVKLSAQSVRDFCHETSGEAWSLCAGLDNTIYLQHEGQQALDQQVQYTAEAQYGTGDPQIGFTTPGESQIGFTASGDAPRGFDFTSAQHVPTLPVFGAPQEGNGCQNPPPWPSWPTLNSDSTPYKSDITVGDVNSAEGSFTGTPEPPPTPQHHARKVKPPTCTTESATTQSHVHAQIQQLTRSSVSQATIKDYLHHVATRSAAGSIPAVNGAVHNGVDGVDVESKARTTASKPAGRAEIMQDIPAELQGVSVRDLIKALGIYRVEKDPSQSSKMNDCSPEATIASGTFNAQSDLKDVVVKDLVRLIGESRVNGNGVTPPRTPPGTPKRLSRSSSPRVITAGHHSLPSSGRGSPNLALSSSPGHTPPRTPPIIRRDLAASLSHPGGNRRDLSPSLSPRFASPVRGRRSGSSSPHRGGFSPSRLPPVSREVFEHKPSSAFTIGPASPKDEVRLSPKSGRKDRGRQLRSKRSASPVHHRDKTPSRATPPRTAPSSSTTDTKATFTGKETPPQLKEPLREAMSPTLAECLRAVFAAFVWHEGIVHDAMACASFLKFHPVLTKEQRSNAVRLPTLGGNASPSSDDPGQEDQVEDVFTDVLKHNFRRASEVRNVNEHPMAYKERHHSDSRPRSRTVTSSVGTSGSMVNEKTPVNDTSEDNSDNLPKTLQYLVYFWEKLSLSTQSIVEQNRMQPSPAANVQKQRQERLQSAGSGSASASGNSAPPGNNGAASGNLGVPGNVMAGAVPGGNAKKKKELRAQQQQQQAPGAGGARGNMFGDAASMVFAGSERETLCELCGNTFPHPVTYHMRQAHPGCGNHAGGLGYNSGGNFCGGWAGSCGDGGVGGSTWYLMCDTCREKYLREKRHGQREHGVSGSGKKNKKRSGHHTSTLSVTNRHIRNSQSSIDASSPHVIMKNNAMFLLDFGSSAGLNIPSGRHSIRRTWQQTAHTTRDGTLPSVSEDVSCDRSPFPQTPFLFLSQLGAERADSAFAEDVIFSNDSITSSTSSTNSAMSMSQHNQLMGSNAPNDPSFCVNRVTRSGSMGSDQYASNMLHTTTASCHSALVSPESEPLLTPGRSVLFQRSISEIATSSPPTNFSPANTPVANETNVENKISVRRRNKSGDVSAESGMSLLKKPSAAMSKMIDSCERVTTPTGRDCMSQQPVMSFVVERHNLHRLQLSMRQAIRRSACRVLAFQAFNWLLRNVTQPTCLHDLLWFMVSCLSQSACEIDDELQNVHDSPNHSADRDRKDNEQDKLTMCDHPVCDVELAGEAVQPLREVFHMFLQSVADVMMYLNPGSPLQQMAVRCWCLKFKASDHMFLHKSHVFSNISKILSKSEEWSDLHVNDANNMQSFVRVECLKDLTQITEMKASSRQLMIASLTDNSTETFWESADDDRNKVKTLTLTCSNQHLPTMIYIHIDNVRDLLNKVSQVIFSGGQSLEELHPFKQCDVDSRHSGWISCYIGHTQNCPIMQLELKGSDVTLRVRQVKVLGELCGESCIVPGRQLSSIAMQQRNCEAETLTVFRLLTKQVFGRLIVNSNVHSDTSIGPSEPRASPNFVPGQTDLGQDSLTGSLVSTAPDQLFSDTDTDLKEHMVSILFSRSKLSHLQKQVCVHIVQAIRKETQRLQEDWENALQQDASNATESISDTYCFELLSMVLALSGSTVGCTYLSQQHGLIQDMFSLLHTATPRVQRQVISLLRRVLPEVAPRTFANLLSVPHLPPKEFSILPPSVTSSVTSSMTFDPDQAGILDVFLACIAKSLSIQTKVKSYGSGKSMSSFVLSDCLTAKDASPVRWWLRGSMSIKLANDIISLLKDMASGRLSEVWSIITKSAIAESILALTKLDGEYRLPGKCVHTPTLWLALASLCVLDREHVERLSSGQWIKGGDVGLPKPTCDNHDDGDTTAIILCNVCGNLCADCDRFLHLHRRTRTHQRQVFKEEEESIKVDLHEGCGRMKLFWLMALADAKTLKAMVEFREGNKGKTSVGSLGVGMCRFCGSTDNTGILAIGNVCAEPECQSYAKSACSRTLPCGHACGGILNEKRCLPCLHGCHTSLTPEVVMLKQDAEDMCMICFTEALSAAPAIQLSCGHVFHLHCCKMVLEKKWIGPRITFGFSHCPICKADMQHPELSEVLDPVSRLYADVRRKALMRLEYEGCDPVISGEDPAVYAMQRYAYYVCYRCQKAYYGGEARCEEQAGAAETYDPEELVCGGCSDVARAQMCAKHGSDFLEYKCRYCCSVAVFFCFGTTHFCNACHDDFQRVTNLSKDGFPHCPAGPKAVQLEGEECPLHVQHPPTGEEFALGCGVCRNASTF